MSYWKIWGNDGFDKAYPYTIEGDLEVLPDKTLLFRQGGKIICAWARQNYSYVEPSDWPVNQNDYFVGER